MSTLDRRIQHIEENLPQNMEPAIKALSNLVDRLEQLLTAVELCQIGEWFFDGNLCQSSTDTNTLNKIMADEKAKNLLWAFFYETLRWVGLSHAEAEQRLSAWQPRYIPPYLY